MGHYRPKNNGVKSPRAREPRPGGFSAAARSRSGPGRQGRHGKPSASSHLFGQAQTTQDEATHIAHFRTQGRIIEAAEAAVTI